SRVSLSPPSPSEPTVVPATATETPFFFEAHDRPLYAVHHAPRRGRPGAPGVVVVTGLGVEQLTVYRNNVRVARALAELGFPVLHYHPRGHGDSAGDWAEVTHDRLVEDARAAGAELLRRSGAGRLAWLGVRFGALAAAAALDPERDVALALWEPVHQPLDYFRSWLRGLLYSQVSRGERPSATVEELLERVERDGHVDVHGYHLHRALLASARDRELAGALTTWHRPTLLAQIQSRARLSDPHAALVARLERQGSRVETALVRVDPGWHFIANPAWEDDDLVRRTAEWLDAVA
ncbi:MAG: serine aminopeptidase domain-containing protein, partial [Candidatus Eisenbacteria bacterium]